MASFLQWECHRFDGFSLNTLYEMLQLRQRVFVVEQQSIYEDLDGLDQQAWHLLGRDGAEQLVAYARLLAPGVKYPDAAAIGRVVLEPIRRGTGLGAQLLGAAVQHCEQLFPGQPIMLSAQIAAQRFYHAFDFIPVSEPYDDGGILHVDMRRELGRA
jgi:ElaA protein